MKAEHVTEIDSQIELLISISLVSKPDENLLILLWKLLETSFIEINLLTNLDRRGTFLVGKLFYYSFYFRVTGVIHVTFFLLF
jgi:hypothetical protein